MKTSALAAVHAILAEVGADDTEEGVIGLLYGSACSEAAELMERAAKLSNRAGGHGHVSATDLRLAAELRRGTPPSSAQARRLREQRNQEPLPDICSFESLELPEDCRLLPPISLSEPSGASDQGPWEVLQPKPLIMSSDATEGA
eukprot:CAMPEP_0172891096 /NCGR_PEP_ID=MMETSP1075-20121228/142994_1 /TAXON_ID=2916 /ORGANISM="Ceratium fusus, Strain PA161109" /LENGTH=144 /DNA_ID=CAMNT_0013745493 /DNA_START=1 /DNA_END=431 /DNA_ORIENTATION=+